MKRMLSIFALLSFAFVLTSITPAFAGPKTGDIWICPSVSTNNPNGMWVLGGHGAYYIIKPGTASPKWPMILNPTGNLEEHAPHVEHLAQHKAGWGLYHSLDSYPYFEGMAMVLEDGAEFIYDEFGIEIDPMTMINVVPYVGTAWYYEGAMTLYANVTLAAAVFW